jgi:subtilisin-like proprotein convertase family protein
MSAKEKPMRVGLILVFLLVSGPLSFAQAEVQEEVYQCQPKELSFGVNNAFVRAMTEDSSQPSDSWLLYMPGLCGQSESTLRTALPFEIETIEQPIQIQGSFIIELAESDNLREKLNAIDLVERWSAIHEHTNIPRFIPNDPSFSSQWHLLNTGQGTGTIGEDANVTGAWDSATGNGVLISVVDDGVDHQHSDLSPNYLTSIDYDYCGNDGDPTPTSNDGHGTAAAGVAAAKGNDNNGVTGAALDADLIGLRLIACSNTDQDEADAIGHRRDIVGISSNSWGPSDNGRTLKGPEPLLQASLEDNVYLGRGGLGTITTLAGGNGRTNGDNSNYDGYANTRFTIGVAAIADSGYQSYYSEDGANILVAAHSNGGSQGITTTDIRGSGGYTSSDIYNNFGGTSSATPLTSGVIALMLDANPTLTYRDVQHVLVHSARTNDASDTDWSVNGAGHDFNHKYGHGALDAGLAVHIAANWTNVGPELNWTSGEQSISQTIPDNTANGLSDTVVVDAGLLVETVEVRFDADHTYRGDIEVKLTSPDGTISRLAEVHNDNNNNFNEWVFSSVLHWDESSDGAWTIEVNDNQNGGTGTWNHWELLIHGAEEVIDTDNDGLPDEDEENIHNTDPLDSDTDNDNLPDGFEIFNSSTNPTDDDTDDDLLLDGQEVLVFLTNPLQSDTDSDGLNDGTEVLVTNSNPLVYDMDEDADGWYWFQDCNDTNPLIKPMVTELLDGVDNNCVDGIDEGFAQIDSDNDRLSDWAEFHVQNTDWLDADSDDDGLEDGDEVEIYFSDPTTYDPDDDQDGYYWFQDCDDINPDRNPGLDEWLNGIDDDCDEAIDEDFIGLDRDRDGLLDLDEFILYGTDWLDADTDDDGLQDGYEFFINTNPLIADLDNDEDGVRWFNDCDDNDSSISPYKTEVRNGIDDNCNNEIDEGIEPLAPKILVVSIDYSQQTIEQPIKITTYANQDTLEIIYEFEPGLVIEIQQNNAIINSVNEGTFGGSVCAIADVTIDCQQFTFTFVEVEEDVVEPSEKQDPKQSASYLSQVSQHFLFIAIGTVILLAIVAIGWEREKTVQQWQAIPPQYVGNVPAAPDLSILNKGFDNR